MVVSVEWKKMLSLQLMLTFGALFLKCRSAVCLNPAVSQFTGVVSVPVRLTQNSLAVTALNHRNVPLLSQGWPLYSFSQFT